MSRGFFAECSKAGVAVLLAALLTPSTGLAETTIYRTTDAEGNVVFTDAPHATSSNQSERVEIQPTNTTPPPPEVERVMQPAEPKKATTKWEVGITSPANETTIPMGPGNFSVGAEVKPALGAGQQLQLMLDGSPQGEPRQTGSWDLTNVFRGEHKLTVRVVNDSGKTLATSEPVTVYVMRPIQTRVPGI